MDEETEDAVVAAEVGIIVPVRVRPIIAVTVTEVVVRDVKDVREVEVVDGILMDTRRIEVVARIRGRNRGPTREIEHQVRKWLVRSRVRGRDREVWLCPVVDRMGIGPSRLDVVRQEGRLRFFGWFIGFKLGCCR